MKWCTWQQCRFSTRGSTLSRVQGMEETWVTNHHVVLTANMCQCTHSCECFYETFMLKVENMRWLWVVMILTFWVDIRDFLLTQRGKPAPKCPCVIGVLSTSIPVWWCWDVKTLMPHILENPRSGGSLSKMFLPLDFSFGWRFPPKDTAEARAEREVHEAATKKLWIIGLGWSFLTKPQFQWKDPSASDCPKTYSWVYIRYLWGGVVSFIYGGSV